MTAQEVIDKYTEMFGGWPEFMFMDADDDYIVQELLPCIESGKEYDGGEDGADY